MTPAPQFTIQYTCPKLRDVLHDQIHNRDCYGLRLLPVAPKLIVDIGANVGSFALFARSVYPEARVVCYEPCPETFRMLQHNIEVNRQAKYIQAFNCALGDGNPVKIVHGADSGSNRTASGGEIPSKSLGRIMSEAVKPRTSYFVKLDCEGGEWTQHTSPQTREWLLGAEGVAAELHYRCAKWPNALPIHEAEQWVRELRMGWAGEGDYHRLGFRAGMLRLRRRDV